MKTQLKKPLEELHQPHGSETPVITSDREIRSSPMDNRPEAIQMQKMQALIPDSPRMRGEMPLTTVGTSSAPPLQLKKGTQKPFDPQSVFQRIEPPVQRKDNPTDKAKQITDSQGDKVESKSSDGATQTTNAPIQAKFAGFLPNNL